MNVQWSRNVVEIFFIFYKEKFKKIRKVELEHIPSECRFVFFPPPITIPSLLLLILSHFFLSPKDFLLVYFTLKFPAPPKMDFLFSSQSLSHHHLTLHPPCFFYFMISSS